MIDLDGIAMIWLRDLLRFFRERSQLLGSVSRPVLWLLILGTGLGAALRPGVHGTSAAAGESYTQFIFPGIIGMSLIFASIQSAISIIWDREFGFLKEVLVAPVSRTSVAVGKALSGATLAVVQGAITLVFAPIVGVKFAVFSALTLVPVMFLIGFALTGVGILIAARMTSFEGFGTISNFLVMPMYFLSGAIFPPVHLPEWLYILVRVNPMSYGVDALRATLLHRHYFPLPFDFGFLAAFAALMVAIGVIAFTRPE
jgi:ABC-2 type transport system permease protein